MKKYLHLLPVILVVSALLAAAPFELPQESPERHRMMLKSYNIPEFMKGPVVISPQTFADVLKTDGMPPVEYKSSLAK